MRNGLIILMFLIVQIASGQTKKHNNNDQLRSLNWDVIGTVKFKLTEKNELLPIYDENITRFKNKTFDLQGYLIPLKNRQKHQKFLLATLPINQCYFCGKNGVPIMVMIEMENAIAFTDKPIRVKGILKLTNDNATYQPPVSLVNAKLII
jgi:hypothetical protein